MNCTEMEQTRWRSYCIEFFKLKLATILYILCMIVVHQRYAPGGLSKKNEKKEIMAIKIYQKLIMHHPSPL